MEAVVGRPEYINPILARSDVDRDLVALIFNGITRVNERSQIVPDLAQGWQVSSDGCTYTFDLRRDVMWHDGTLFTADDVIFTVQAMQERYYQGPARLANLWRRVQVEKVHRHKVRFILEEPFAPFLDYTTIGILPAHLLADVPAELLPRQPFNLRPIGTGPFQISEVHLDQGYLTLKANPAYFGSSPRMRRAEIQFYPDRASILDAYDHRAVTGIGGLLPQELTAVRERPSLALYSAPMSREVIIFLNLTHSAAPFLAEREVRQALLFALDRRRLIDQRLAGQGIVAHSIVLPNTWAYNPDLPHYTYDPQRARSLLEQAGWRSPSSSSDNDWVRQREGVQLALSLLVDGSNSTHVSLAEEIARQWAEVGVKAHVEQKLRQERLQIGNYRAALVECELGPDPDPYPLWHSTQVSGRGQNYTGFSSREADELMEKGRRVTELKERAQLYRRFQEIWAQELPALPLYHPVYNYALDKRIGGVQLALMRTPSDRFRNISQWHMVSNGDK
ncbi:MAG: peptide ABC transporter substrate-binding protein [Chloroflexota bacterium]|nr:peptide ABC transporter substrate-binding protein [Chloroflexota bacterium]